MTIRLSLNPPGDMLWGEEEELEVDPWTEQGLVVTREPVQSIEEEEREE